MKYRNLNAQIRSRIHPSLQQIAPIPKDSYKWFLLTWIGFVSSKLHVNEIVGVSIIHFMTFFCSTQCFTDSSASFIVIAVCLSAIVEYSIMWLYHHLFSILLPVVSVLFSSHLQEWISPNRGSSFIFEGGGLEASGSYWLEIGGHFWGKQVCQKNVSQNPLPLYCGDLQILLTPIGL